MLSPDQAWNLIEKMVAKIPLTQKEKDDFEQYIRITQPHSTLALEDFIKQVDEDMIMEALSEDADKAEAEAWKKLERMQKFNIDVMSLKELKEEYDLRIEIEDYIYAGEILKKIKEKEGTDLTPQ